MVERLHLLRGVHVDGQAGEPFHPQARPLHPSVWRLAQQHILRILLALPVVCLESQSTRVIVHIEDTFKSLAHRQLLQQLEGVNDINELLPLDQLI